MNKDTVEGNWEQFKGKAKQKWAMLGDKDFGLYQEGKVQEFLGRVQENAGVTREQAEKDLKELEKVTGYRASSSNKAA